MNAERLGEAVGPIGGDLHALDDGGACGAQGLVACVAGAARAVLLRVVTRGQRASVRA